jgi:hypothetical protein
MPRIRRTVATAVTFLPADGSNSTPHAAFFSGGRPVPMQHGESSMMTRLFAAAVFSGLAVAATAVPAGAQYPSREACAYYEFPPGTPEYRLCTERELQARRLGRMSRDYGSARILSDSERACAYYGLPPGTPRYERCVRHEVELRSPE